MTPFLAFLLLVGTTVGTSPGVSAVKVNEISFGSAGFVELRNTGTTAADVGGWSVHTCSGGASRILGTIPPNTVLPPGEYFLIVGAAFSGTVPTGLVVDTVDGSGVITRNRHGAHTDSVGLTSSSPCREDSPAKPCADSSLGRDSASRDSDHNADDFACQIPSPGETNQ
ncbi:hypothetical protein UK23_30455 [Lentzea aerocolonigenes]|uniref:LTD domain-containing protein n=1 Tax=Lentzea aerocolonigenes TaxID=68170 RepID=A0A0F0GNI9_LENAE|nr:lamin tail domain-containing protein [Lentzea aerocolonigenes]KJK44156.1 hypothetical protein UK23_30455 [Lentzea aerocolonigenes]